MSVEQCLLGLLVDEIKSGCHFFYKQNVINIGDLSQDDIKNLDHGVNNFPESPTGYICICAIHFKNHILDYSLRKKIVVIFSTH